MEQERRRVERIERRLACRFELAGIPDAQQNVGTITNLSELGVRIESRALCPPGADITVYVQAGEKMIVLLARVVWWRLEQFAHAEAMRFSAGASLLYEVPDWSAFVADMRQGLQKRPAMDARHDAVHRVRLQGAPELLTEYTENLSRGGMYLATDRNLSVGQRMEVEIELPGQAEPIAVQATVAHKLDAAQAAQIGRAAGVGVKFVDWTGPAKERLHHYIRRLDIHRSRQGRVDLAALPKAGALSDYLVPELLIAGAASGATGVLRIEHRGIFKSVYLRDGRPVYVDSSLGRDRFGDFLVGRDVIAQSQLADALGHASNEKIKLGEALVAMQLLTDAQIQEWLLACHEQKMFEMFSWFDGNFAYEPQTQFPAMVSELPLRVEGLVFEGVRHGYDSNVVCAWTGMSAEMTFALVPGRAPELEALPPEVAAVLRTLKDGEKRIDVMGDRTGHSFETLAPLLYAMWLFGWVSPEARADDLPLVEPVVEEENGLPEVAIDAELEPEPNAQRAEARQKAASFAARGDEMLARGDMLGAFKQYGLAVAFDPKNPHYASKMRELEALVGQKPQG